MNPKKAQTLTSYQSKVLINLVREAESLDGKVLPQFFKDLIPVQCILKRIEILGLPIKFTNSALMGLVLVMCDSPDAIVVALIDCLGLITERTDLIKGLTITLKEICELYPFGFYTAGCLADRVKEIQANPGMGWNFVFGG